MGTEAFIGEIALYPYATLLPDGWLRCEGQSLAITSNQVLFAVIGTQFGGDGRTSFNLPDLRGSAVMGAGANPNLTPRAVGDKAGQAAVALKPAQVGHSHALLSSGQVDPNKDKTRGPLPTSNLGALSITHPGAPSTAEFSYALNGQPTKMMHPDMISSTGGDVPHENRQPYLAMSYCICVQGVFPN